MILDIDDAPQVQTRAAYEVSLAIGGDDVGAVRSRHMGTTLDAIREHILGYEGIHGHDAAAPIDPPPNSGSWTQDHNVHHDMTELTVDLEHEVSSPLECEQSGLNVCELCLTFL